MQIIPMTAAHWPQVKAIYESGIATGNATFQTSAPGWEEWDRSHVKTCRLVAIDEHQVLLGWAALTPVSGRCVYAGVGEVSVYISAEAQGRGTGTLLLNALIAASEQNGFWTLQAGIFPENTASVKLHGKCGFRLIGRREKIGQMNGQWRDTLLLERRSTTTGV
ncbi:N-acetyltransferase family protein [Chitinophaga agrisoli]|uniref:N-acetyltransferase family protein n=1 Tax=Chitinophaga agrisoli TaxID=2607653 RepID=A0A5B2VWK3_9BACT|nr:GNAT family N-acetyltransferase [Chitinophaga agrisoli]KAA2242692.1 N-acetyltransferase family protein [Chitinophaga agrisoli]